MNASFSRFVSPLLGLCLALPLLAQQKVCLSVHKGPATGTNTAGQPAELAAHVEGVQVAVPTAAGQTAAQASAAHEAAFVAAGFTTVRNNPNEFCVTAGPGGPITRGLRYGTDDPGLDLDSDCGALLLPPAGDPKTKTNGVGVPLPPVQQPPLPFGGRIDVHVYIRVGGLRIRVVVHIQLAPNLPGWQLRQQIEQQMEAHGFFGHVVTVADPMAPNQRMEVLQLERTAAGDPIDGIEFEYDAMSRRIVRNVTGAGMLPDFGAAEYGIGSPGIAGSRPWSRVIGMPPQVNGFFDVFHQVDLPLAIGGFALSTGPSALPILNGVLLVDPSALVLALAMTDANGALRCTWNVPNAPGLVGVGLCSQGIALGAGQLAMSTGITFVVGP